MDVDRDGVAGYSWAMTVMKVAVAMQTASAGIIATTQVTDTVYRGDGLRRR
jgi:hypothetical protein